MLISVTTVFNNIQVDARNRREEHVRQQLAELKRKLDTEADLRQDIKGNSNYNYDNKNLRRPFVNKK